MKLRIGTRKSPLALAQAELTRSALEAAGVEASVHTFTTSGDRFTDRPLSDIGGKGLFTKELEEALFARAIDLAVHSAKDMQTVLPEGLVIAAALPREDVRDALIAKGGERTLAELPIGAALGSSSLRRTAQALMVRPDLKIVPLRGNVQTRLGKIAQGEAYATLLAVAGLNRLKLDPMPGAPLETHSMLPAVAQGAIALQCRGDDAPARGILAQLNCADTLAAITCERAMLRVLDGSCRTPIAGLAIATGERLTLKGLVLETDGRTSYRAEMRGPVAQATELGEAVGQELLRLKKIPA